MPDEPLHRLQQLMRDLFQLDQAADLDFGVYRLFRIKRDEVAAFIDRQLPRTVDEAFGAAAAERREEVAGELSDGTWQLEDQFPDHEVTGPDGRVIDDVRAVAARLIQYLVARHDVLRTALATLEASEAQKTEVFNHLHAFFSRYYEDADYWADQDATVLDYLGKNGSPKEHAKGESIDRSPAVVKILRLEAYEDALHNTASPASTEREADREHVLRGVVGEDEYRLRYDEDGDRRYRVVMVRDRDERRTLVLWRDMDDLDAAVERRFLETKLDAAEPPFDRVLINGDSGCPRVESLDPLFKRLIEEEERL